MYKLTIHTDNGTFEINIDKLQELDTILINYDGYDYVPVQGWDPGNVEQLSDCVGIKTKIGW